MQVRGYAKAELPLKLQFVERNQVGLKNRDPLNLSLYAVTRPCRTKSISVKFDTGTTTVRYTIKLNCLVRQ